jgi:hypothetical protein
MQTQVPICCKLGVKSLPSHSLASHLDIFPTILHHVFGKEIFSHWFDGESLLKPRRKNFVISTRYNGNKTPFEFLIHNGEQEVTLRFANPNNVFKSNALEILSYKNISGTPLQLNAEQIQATFEEPLTTLFKRDEEI